MVVRGVGFEPTNPFGTGACGRLPQACAFDLTWQPPPLTFRWSWMHINFSSLAVILYEGPS